ncbi:Ribosomal protein L32e [mine drainage metagenome]|uniref:Large ribosomal subunit protein eL32 n=1 Tax=mine drainage metagenome TaxID=410659 RepID=T0ZZS6_9ZZZZ
MSPDPVAAPEPEETPAPKPARRRVRAAPPAEEKKEIVPADATAVTTEEPAAPRAPKRASLDPESAKLLRLRRELDRHRPLFVRQAAHRYYRIGRDESWRRPRGLQSKQRRHYGYRSVIVRVGYRSPAKVRDLVPSGFRPIIIRTTGELEKLDATKEAAIIARTVGTRRRLTLEETARRLGIHVLNPITTPEGEE